MVTFSGAAGGAHKARWRGAGLMVKVVGGSSCVVRQFSDLEQWLEGRAGANLDPFAQDLGPGAPLLLALLGRMDEAPIPEAGALELCEDHL